jgi:hypothetical protein
MNKIICKLISLLIVFSVNSYSLDIEDVVRDLNLSAGSKASIQWKRIFKSAKKMKRYGIYALNEVTKKELEEYLVSHAIDSDRPTVAGGF